MKKLTNIIEGLFDVEDTVEEIDNREEVKNWYINTLKTKYLGEADGKMWFESRGIHKNQITQKTIASCPVKHLDDVSIDINVDIVCPKFNRSFCNNINSRYITVANCHISDITFSGDFMDFYQNKIKNYGLEITFINCVVDGCEFKKLASLNFDEKTRFKNCLFDVPHRPVVRIKLDSNKNTIASYLSDIFGNVVNYAGNGVLQVPESKLLEHFGIDSITDYNGTIIYKELRQVIDIRPWRGSTNLTQYGWSNNSRYEGTIRNKFKLN